MKGTQRFHTMTSAPYFPATVIKFSLISFSALLSCTGRTLPRDLYACGLPSHLFLSRVDRMLCTVFKQCYFALWVAGHLQNESWVCLYGKSISIFDYIDGVLCNRNCQLLISGWANTLPEPLAQGYYGIKQSSSHGAVGHKNCPASSSL